MFVLRLASYSVAVKASLAISKKVLDMRYIKIIEELSLQVGKQIESENIRMLEDI